MRPNLNLLRRLLANTNAAFKRRPVIYGLSLAAVEGMISDGFTQNVIEGRSGDRFQWYRLKTFGVFNIYVAGFDYAVINKFLPKVFPVYSWKSVLGKIFVYEVLFAPIYYFPGFYYVRQSLHDNHFGFDSFKTGLKHYKQNYKADLPTMWAVWIPVTAVVFTVMPPHLVLPFMVGADLCWLLGLSFYRGDIGKSRAKMHP